MPEASVTAGDTRHVAYGSFPMLTTGQEAWRVFPLRTTSDTQSIVWSSPNKAIQVCFNLSACYLMASKISLYCFLFFG